MKKYYNRDRIYKASFSLETFSSGLTYVILDKWLALCSFLLLLAVPVSSLEANDWLSLCIM